MSSTNGNLIDVCQAHADALGEKRVFTFTKYRPRKEVAELSWKDLDRNARALAQRIQTRASVGDRVLLLFRPGLEFTSAFMACLYAGVVAVPSPVPRAGLGSERLNGIVQDSGARLALSEASVRELIETEQHHAAPDRDLAWLLFDDVDLADQGQWSKPHLSDEDLALLQYSSGSTGTPKGVMVSHGNLIHQLNLLRDSMASGADSRFVSWLPIFHDLGLIAGVLSPIYVGGSCALMAPASFVEKPVRWLELISQTAGEISAAPNFAYELCVRSIGTEQCKELDLSRWRYAMNAAEPIRARTIDSFVSKFAKCGFDRAAVYPAYGLAEATLMVTGGGRAGEPQVCAVDSQTLEKNEAVPVPLNAPNGITLVGSGQVLAGQDVKIVDPETREELGEKRVGEVWVRGPSVASGYWQRKPETVETFQATSQQGARQAHGHYALRTGDLGFMLDGELFICGRLKDLILIRGRNLHGPDIERIVESSHPALKPSSGAAFAVDIDDEESLVVVQEVDRHARLREEELDAIIDRIRQEIYEAYEVQPSAVVLMRRGIPKTSSGKIQRRKCRAMFLAGQLSACRRWDSTPKGEAQRIPAEGSAQRIGQAASRDSALTAVEGWLINALAQATGKAPEALGGDCVLEDLALPRAEQMAFIERAEARFSRPLPRSWVTDFKTLGDFAETLAGSNIEASSFAGLSTDQLQFSLDGGQEVRDEPIAIVGIGCRFPGAKGLDEFWDLMCKGVDAVTEVPDTRWPIDQVYDENPLAVGKMNTRRGGFLEDIELMDRNFFQLAVREAIRMDPQHRLMLEVGWEALEDAGMTAEQVSDSRTGVFVGISSSDYAQVQFTDETLTDAYAGLGCALTMAPSRISNFLNLRGPAVAVDTACSSSLSALHQACVSIRQGECEQALAGGVNILLSPVVTMCLTKAGMMSPDGRCKAFDARANGYVRADGAGLVLLKPLSKALADEDTIYALIKGSASNQDGKGSGIAAPNGEAQQRVVLAACEDAGIEPGQLDYVEAHGTGTSVGDPIEVKALGAVVNIGAEPNTHCAIGSVKTNIGHCESAAGVASLIKAAMILKHGIVPPSLHFETPNPQIPFDSLRLRVQTELEELPKRDRPCYVGVNGFGVGGTNVHMVLEQIQAPRSGEPSADDSDAQQQDARQADSGSSPVRPWLLPISARSTVSLKESAHRLASYLRDNPQDGASLTALYRTLTQRRSRLEHSLTVVGRDANELADALEGYAQSNYHANARYAYQVNHAFAASKQAPKLAFVFSGQGSQWWKMGRELYRHEVLFADVIDRIDALLSPLMQWSLVDVLMDDENASMLDQTIYAQPAIFALQLGLVRLYESWGIRADALVGHSVGEVAAACASGALSLEDAVTLIAHRAKLMQASTGNGRMASINTSMDEVLPRIAPYEGRVSIAAVNSPDAIVLSGETEALDELLEEFQAHGIVAFPLPVNYAFHSAQMEPFKQQLIAALGDIAPGACDIPMVSTVTGRWCVDDGGLDAAYWGDNMREKVHFTAALETLVADEFHVFLEVGPSPVLNGAISSTLKALDARGSVLQSLLKESDEQLNLLSTLGELHTLGCEVNWQGASPAVRGAAAPKKLSLPRYSWDRQRYWLSSAYQKVLKRMNAHPLLTARLPVAQSAWRCFLDEQSIPFLNGLIVGDAVQLPSGIAVELALAASCGDGASDDSQATNLVELSFGRPMEFDRGEDFPELQVLAQPDEQGNVSLEVQAKPADVDGKEVGEEAAWRPILKATAAKPCAVEIAPMSLKELEDSSREVFDAAEIYRNLGEKGIDYAQSMQVAKTIWIGDQHVLAKLRLDELGNEAWGTYHLHPLVFEAAEQIGRLCLGYKANAIEKAHIQAVRLIAPTEDLQYAYAKTWKPVLPGHPLPGIDVMLLNAAGEVCLVVEGLTFNEVRDESQDLLRIPSDPVDWLYDIDWQLTPREVTATGGGSFDPASPWLIFSDEAGVGRQLQQSIEDRGHRCVVVRKGDGFAQVDEREFRVSTTSLDDIQRVFDTVFPQGRSTGCNGVIHLWNLDVAPLDDSTTVKTLEHSVGLGVVSTIHLIQGIASSRLSVSPRLWLITAGSQALSGETSGLEVAQAPVWGLGKTIAMEHPELSCSRVDLSSPPTAGELEALVEEIWVDGGETQIALREEQRYLARLVFHHDAAERPQGSDEQEAAPVGGAVEAIADQGTAEWVPPERRSLRAGEIEIEVAKVGVEAGSGESSAIDSREQGVSGQQAVGRVVRTGLGVDDLRVGDQVAVLGTHCLASYITLPAGQAAVLPQSLGDEVAAASCRPYVSALFGLKDLVSLKAGERVFIHGADTARGFAAAQVAVWLGADVGASVLSAQSERAVRELGVRAVFPSAKPSLFQSLCEHMSVGGMDVMVNCCAGFDLGHFRPSFSGFGRCLDLTDSGGNQTGLRTGNIGLFVVDEGHLIETGKQVLGALLNDVVRYLADGTFRPLASTVIALQDWPDAAPAGSQAIVIDLPETSKSGTDIATAFHDNATYLITGGLGALGLAIAERMAQSGARHIVLVGRREPSPQAQEVIARLREQGVECVAMSVDMAQTTDVQEMLQRIRASMPTLRGLIHAAGILENALLVNQDEQCIRAVMPAKVDGAWHLHEQTCAEELDFFVMFSSLASLIGSAGQGNYAAANGFLDGLAEHRKRLGLAGLSIHWGPWADIGMAADAHNQARLEERGMGMLPAEKCMDLLEALIISRQQGAIGAIAMNWVLWSRAFPAAGRAPFVADLVPKNQDVGQAGRSQLTADHIASLDAESQLREVRTTLHRAVCQSLQLDAENLDVDVPLSAVGLDSIVALELKNRIESMIDVTVNTLALLKGRSIRDLARDYRDQLLHTGSASDEASETSADPETEAADDYAQKLLVNIDEMSNEEVEELLCAIEDDKEPAGSV
ncbi:MAG: SDR family NAD(P)-dependent oxidoreductase [Pseudomonadota bacterium]